MRYEELLNLKDILDRKKECLQTILHLVKAQEELIFTNESDLDFFGEYMKEKEELILKLTKFNDEYEEFMEQIGEAGSVKANSDIVQQITQINQAVITLGKEIQDLEGKSKVSFEAYVRQEREKIKRFRLNNQMTSNYYKSMNGVQLEDSYFMDKRK